MIRDPLLPPLEPEDSSTCERCGAVVTGRSAMKHENWHEVLQMALRAGPFPASGKPPVRRPR